MLRFRYLPALALAFFIALAYAAAPSFGDEPRFRTTPEVLALFEETKDAMDDLPSVDAKTAALFQLLTFETKLDDKSAARSTAERLMKLLPEIKSENVRNQLLEGIAFARAEMGDIEAGMQTLADIKNDVVRARSQLTLGEMLLFEVEAGNQPADLDLSDLFLRAAAGGSIENQPDVEALAMALLGREFGRQGKTGQSKVAFDNAAKLAAGLDREASRNLRLLIVRSQAQCGLVDLADARISEEADPEVKQVMALLVIQALAEKTQFDDAEKRASLSEDERIRDNAYALLGQAAAKTESGEKIAELAKKIGDAEMRSAHYGRILADMVTLKRFKEAFEVTEKAEVPPEMVASLRLMWIESLMNENRLDEATEAVKTLDDDQLRRTAGRHLLLKKLQNGLLIAAQIDVQADFSPIEKEEIEALREESEAAGTKPGSLDDRLTLYSNIFGKQMQLFDLLGGEKTLNVMQSLIGEETDPAKQIAHRLVLAMIQRDMGQKDKALENLLAVAATIAAVEDIMDLKDLVLENADEALPQVAATITESMVRDQAINVLLSTVDSLIQMERWDEARTILRQAYDLNVQVSDPLKRCEILLFLARKSAELETAATNDND